MRNQRPALSRPFADLRILVALAAVFTSILIVSGTAIAKSGLPVPRFVSLGSDKANVRNGPGKRYPIGWVFVRRGVPLEVIAEYELWRKIRDVDGAVGWIHRSLLSNRRSATVKGKVARSLRRQPDTRSEPVAKLEPGVTGQVLACDGDWCRFEVDSRSGWIERTGLWGVLPEERFN